jgi:PKD repeat protein
MKRTFTLGWTITLLSILTQMISCKKDKTEQDFIASFTYKVDSYDYKKVEFTNISKNYQSVSWDFGDSSAISTESNPVHKYNALRSYTVKLTATSPTGLTNVWSRKIIITDPNAVLTRLVGDTAKTWKLIHTVAPGVYPLEVGPYNRSTIWWAVGLNNTELANRPCMWNDEWTFKRDGTMIFNANGDFWAENPIFSPSNICQSTSNMTGVGGKDLSAWGNGIHRFRIDKGANPTITALGHGAFIGFFKSATHYEVTKLNPMVQDSITYNLIKVTDGAIDTLIIEAEYRFELPDTQPGGYWRYTLVHYDNPADEPPMP